MLGDLLGKMSQLDLISFGVGVPVVDRGKQDVLVGSKGVTSTTSQGRCMKGSNTGKVG